MSGAGRAARDGAGEFAGRLALVTGAAQGIGAATAARLAEQGARLALCDRDDARLREVAGTLRGQGADVAQLVCDVADVGAVAAMVEWGFSRDTCKNAPQDLIFSMKSLSCRIFLAGRTGGLIWAELRQ